LHEFHHSASLLISDDCDLKRMKLGEAVAQSGPVCESRSLGHCRKSCKLNSLQVSLTRKLMGRRKQNRFALHCRIICTNGTQLSEFKKIVNPRGCYIAMAPM